MGSERDVKRRRNVIHENQAMMASANLVPSMSDWPLQTMEGTTMSAVSTKLKLAIATAAAPLAMSWGGAALAACPPLGTDAGLLVFSIEGPVSDISVLNQTATVLGATIEVPPGGVDTGFAGAPNLIPLTQLVNNTAPGAVRSYVNGTIIADGQIVLGVTDTDCRYVADTMFFEFAENVLVGVITDIDPAPEPTFFEVNGRTVKMNDDPRVPTSLIDLGGNEITLQDLVASAPLGAAATVEGYFFNNILYAKLADTGVIVSGQPGFDTVVIEVADFRIGGNKREFDVRGLVTPISATTVDIYPGGTVVNGVCVDTPSDGLQPINNVALTPDPALGQSTFRLRLRPLAGTGTPSVVCVQSDGGGALQLQGGVAQRTVDVRP